MTETEWFTGQIRSWKLDANLFVRQACGAVPDAWQARALRLVSNPATRRLAFKACKGPGKTAVLAWIILWFLTCHFESKVGCTSITEANIDTNLWPELLKWMNRSRFLQAAFIWTKSAVIRRGNENWFAVKRTWPKSGDAQQQADALAGLHADDVMFVLDESGGIPQAVMVTAEAVLSTLVKGHRAIVVQSGNPTHTTGPLHRACTIDKALWEVIEITGDPLRPDRSPRIDPVWAQEEIDKYGRDNPWVLVNVLGQFPPSSINALLGVEEVNAAMRRHLPIDVYSWAQKRLGVDVARFGDDRTVIFPRQGLASFRPIIMRGQRTTAIAARVAVAQDRWGAEQITVDDTGHWGHGVIDNLIAMGRNAIPVFYNGKALDPRFKNTRSEMWMKGAEAIRNGAALPNLPEMVGELTEVTYTFIGGVFVLEEKDQVKKRIQRSPDLADAYMQTYVYPDVPGDMMDLTKRQGHARTGDDPQGTGRAEHDRGQDDGGTYDPYSPKLYWQEAA